MVFQQLSDFFPVFTLQLFDLKENCEEGSSNGGGTRRL
jgi:hypothetical protein